MKCIECGDETHSDFHLCDECDNDIKEREREIPEELDNDW